MSTLLDHVVKGLAKQSQHFDSTYHNIVGSCCEGAGQTIATFQRDISRHCWQHVAHVWPPCCNMLQHVGLREQFFEIENQTCSVLRHNYVAGTRPKEYNIMQHLKCWRTIGWPFINLRQQHATCRNILQQGGQTRATFCAQQCCDLLCWNVVIVCPGLKVKGLGLSAYKHFSFAVYIRL